VCVYLYWLVWTIVWWHSLIVPSALTFWQYLLCEVSRLGLLQCRSPSSHSAALLIDQYRAHLLLSFRGPPNHFHCNWETRRRLWISWWNSGEHFQICSIFRRLFCSALFIPFNPEGMGIEEWLISLFWELWGNGKGNGNLKEFAEYFFGMS